MFNVLITLQGIQVGIHLDVSVKYSNGIAFINISFSCDRNSRLLWFLAVYMWQWSVHPKLLGMWLLRRLRWQLGWAILLHRSAHNYHTIIRELPNLQGTLWSRGIPTMYLVVVGLWWWRRLLRRKWWTKLWRLVSGEKFKLHAGGREFILQGVINELQELLS